MAGRDFKWYHDDMPPLILYNFCRELPVEACLEEMRAIMGREIPNRDLIETLYKNFQKGEYKIKNSDQLSMTICSILKIYTLLHMDARLNFAIADRLHIIKKFDEFREILLLLNRRTVGHLHIQLAGLSRVLSERQSWSKRMVERLKERPNIVVADAFWIYHSEIGLPEELKDVPKVQLYNVLAKTLVVVFCSRDLNFKVLVRIFSPNRKNPFKWYLRRPMRRVFKMIKARCPGVPLLYHYDSIMSFMHRTRVVELANYYGLEIIHPPPCGPDLAFSHHGLFAELKTLVKPPVIEFDNMRDVGGMEIVVDWDQILDNVWHHYFRNWVSYLVSSSTGNGRFM